MAKPRMTVAEVCRDLRNCGMGLTHKTVSDGIASGLFPFGKLIGVNPSGRRTFMILRKDYEKWKEEALSKMARSTAEPTSSPTRDWELISSNTYTQESNDIMWEIVIRGWARKKPADMNK